MYKKVKDGYNGESDSLLDAETFQETQKISGYFCEFEWFIIMVLLGEIKNKHIERGQGNYILFCIVVMGSYV